MLWVTVEGERLGDRLTVKHCGTTLKAMIVGGKASHHGDFPWMVSIHEKVRGEFKHVCGGSIINEHWIVTAAHCIDYPDDNSQYLIYSGLHRLSEKSNRRTRLQNVSKIIIHEDYNKDTFQSDIALLRTEVPMEIEASSGYVNGVCLPDTQEEPTGPAIVTGWGHTTERGENSDVLKAAQVPIMNRHVCNFLYIGQVLDTMICAGSFGEDSCQNDSGGPLVQKNEKGAYTLIGVVSHGSGCGGLHPGVYTKVASFTKWLEQNMN